MFVLAGQSNMVGYPPPGPAPIIARALGGVSYVQCAVSGSTIADWQPGQPDFDACVHTIGTSAVTGIIFAQGESEAISGNPWAEGFRSYVAAMRARYGPVPVVFAQTGTLWPGAQYQQQVRDEQANVSVPYSVMVVTTDLPTWDGLHFTPSAYSTLGARLVSAWWFLTSARFAATVRLAA